MLALIVVANPSPNSLSHAMTSAAERVLVARSYEIALHDLYAEHFDPVQPTGEDGNVGSSNVLVEQHCSELARADLILVFHPNWWGQPPAILTACDSRQHGPIRQPSARPLRSAIHLKRSGRTVSSDCAE
jgi:NAD(P)H dehydrogenase (quinone)